MQADELLNRIMRMSLAIIQSRAVSGVNAPPVTVEVHISRGLPRLTMVGLPATVVKESKDRVRGAIINSRFEFPCKRITINLAPADLPKEGGRFDLPIAIGILAASGQLDIQRLKSHEFIGELALGGGLRSVKAVLPAAMAASRCSRSLVIPDVCENEVSLLEQGHILVASDLLDVCAHLTGKRPLLPAAGQPQRSPCDEPTSEDLADIKGQKHARRALEIAASGGHSMLMCGPPGAGKSMLASRLPGILPTMTQQEALEAASIRSVSSGGSESADWYRRAFRSPHHSASAAALVGGGSPPRPGEISLAHNGVLFLDELPEFNRHVLEVLREPMEKGRVTISRAARQAEYYARFQLIAAMNPCPCGYADDPRDRCECTPEQVRRYRGRLSGPLLDRIDMSIDVVPVARHEINSARADCESSADVRARVAATRKIQLNRQGSINAYMPDSDLERYCTLDEKGIQLIETAMEKFGLSARSYNRIRRLSRTIADMGKADHIAFDHVAEAIGYRIKEAEKS